VIIESNSWQQWIFRSLDITFHLTKLDLIFLDFLVDFLIGVFHVVLQLAFVHADVRVPLTHLGLLRVLEHAAHACLLAAEALLRNVDRVEIAHPAIIKLVPLVFLLIVLLFTDVGVVVAHFSGASVHDSTDQVKLVVLFGVFQSFLL